MTQLELTAIRKLLLESSNFMDRYLEAKDLTDTREAFAMAEAANDLSIRIQQVIRP